MKKLHLIYIVTFLLAFSVTATAQPMAQFAETEFDFGNIGELDGAVTHRFVYKNTGDKPLVVSKVYTSCGCTSPAWSKEPVMPGQEGYVDATFDPRDRPGAFTKSITVMHNGKNIQDVLYISGNVQPRPEPVSADYPYTFFDLRLKKTTVNFGSVSKGETVKQTIDIYNPTKADLVVEPDNDKIPQYLSLTVSPKVLKPGAKGEIKVEFVTKKCDGWDYFDFQAGILVNTYSYKLNFKSIITEKFTAEQIKNPPLIEFPNGKDVSFKNVEKESTVYQKLTYSNTGTSPLEIRAVRNFSDCVSYKINTPVVQPGENGTITIFFNAEGKKNLVTKYLTLVTNSPQSGHDHVLLKISAQIAE